MPAEPSYRFSRYRLLPAQRRLLEDDRALKLGSRAFEMLVVLVENRHRTVSRNELMALVWPGLVVDVNNLQVHVLALRKLLGHPAIATIPGRGYRFTLPVAAEPEVGTSGPGPVSDALPATPQQPHRSLVPMVGRDEEMRALRALIGRSRLVTVTGAGGIGKTRLAQEVASAEVEAGLQADGVWWVELAGLSDAALVPVAVAQALGLQPPGDADIAQAVVRALEGKAALVILDNAEHVLDGVASLVDRLRAGTGRVRLLVTSQQTLRTWEEQVFRPGPLSLPEHDDLGAARASGAVTLFVARARLMQPHFELTEDNRGAVVEICRRLDGIPLAIELAAARVPLLGVEGLRARLDQRFRVLTAGARAVMPRHQTLRAAITWSHGLLDLDEQIVFRRLSVFVGGFSLEAAQAVAACERIDIWDVLEHLGALVDKSLVQAGGGALPRYRMLESTRLYALERLADAGETDALLLRHALHMLELAEAFDGVAQRFGPAAASLDRFDAEHDNLLHALAWCAQAAGDAPPTLGLRLAAASRCYWIHRGLLGVGVEVTDRALARARHLPMDAHRCQALASAAQMTRWMHRFERSAELGMELADAATHVASPYWLAVARCHAGWLEWHRSHWRAAEGHFRWTLDEARTLRDGSLEGNALPGLVEVFDREGRRGDADACFEQMLAGRRSAGDRFYLAVALIHGAGRARRHGDAICDASRLREASALVKHAGSVPLLAMYLAAVADHHATDGKWAAAVETWAASQRRRRGSGMGSKEFGPDVEPEAQADARRALGEAEHGTHWNRGSAASDDEAWVRAAEWTGLESDEAATTDPG